MKAGELLKSGTEQLNIAGIEESRTDAWELFEFVTAMDRAYYYAHMNDEIPGELCSRYMDLISQRTKHIPVQRLIGTREFMGLEFIVKDCLIPRQDTEVLVEEVLKYIEARSMNQVSILDLCTGTGCIPISVIKNSGTQVRAMASDISVDAISTAGKNRNKHELTEDDMEIVVSDLFQNIPVVRMKSFDIITSNPPYIPTSVIPTLSEEVKNNDPYIALDGGEDGLYFYRRILPDAQIYLKNGGMLIMEIGYDQGTEVQNMMDFYGYEDIRIIKDLAGLDRVAMGFKKQSEF